MVIRWRTISNGYYDHSIQRYVDPVNFEQAAQNLDARHRMLTGENQHIVKKTLDDYFLMIKCGNESSPPYNFCSN